jgi:hypothetical protein
MSFEDEICKAGHEAAEDARNKTKEALDHENVDEIFVIKHLKRLSRAKTPKTTYERNSLIRDKEGKVIGFGEGYWTYSKPLNESSTQVKAIEILAEFLNMRSPGKFEFTGKDGGPIECVNYTDLERANRLNYLIQKAITERDKQGG